MRKLILTLFAAVALVGCHNEPTPVVPDTPRAIAFDNVTTRAGLTDLQDDGFGVWAVINNTTVQNLMLMDNQHVEYDETDGWYYSPMQYWIDNSTFNFTATYPYDSNASYFSYNTEDNAVELKVSETPSQIDFLIAENETNTSVEGYETTVNLQFQHMLTSVGLKIWRDGGKHQNDQMRIKSVTLGNIRKGGTYSTTTNTWSYNNDRLTVEKVYENFSDTDNIGAVIVKDDGTLNSGGSEAANPFGDLMLLPQDLDADNSVSLKIVYELKRQNAADWEEAELETVLPSMTLNPGQRYTFNVVLSSVTDITVYYIQTKVDPWGTPQVGGTVIIK